MMDHDALAVRRVRDLLAVAGEDRRVVLARIEADPAHGALPAGGVEDPDVAVGADRNRSTSGRDAPPVGRNSRGPVVAGSARRCRSAFPVRSNTTSAARGRSFRLPRRRGSLPGNREDAGRGRPRGTGRAAPRRAGSPAELQPRRRRRGWASEVSVPRRRGGIPAARRPSSMRRAEDSSRLLRSERLHVELALGAAR